MYPRRSTVLLSYNGVSADSIKPAVDGFTYTDVACGNCDSVSVELTDAAHRWIGPWFPAKGDTLQPTIITENWDGEGQGSSFSCGLFHVDDFSFSGGPPIRLSLEALAVPTDSSFQTTERTITYEDATLQEIGQEVAGRAGIALFYEGEAIKIAKVEQTNQSDCDFYSQLVSHYGLVMKIYNDKIVVFSEATYEGKGPKLTLTPANIDPGWSWNTKMVGVYTGVKYQYTNPDKNETFTVELGEGPRILTCNDAAENMAEANAIARAAINEANKGTTTMTVTLKAVTGLIATDCVEVQDLGQLNGKYYVEKVTHTLGDGYKMSLDLRKVEKRF